MSKKSTNNIKHLNKNSNDIKVADTTYIKRSEFLSKALKLSVVGLLGAGLIVAIVLPLTKSGSNSIKNNITIIPNSRFIHDKSFNEESVNGSKNYYEVFRNDDKKGTIQSEPILLVPEVDAGSDGDVFDVYYEAAIKNGSRSILGNSFFMTEGALTYAKKNPYINFIVLDDSGLAQQASNGYSVDFKSNEVGFLTGVAASLYATFLKQTKPLSSTAFAGLWGGLPIYTVWDWMSGFEQAINWFNYSILGFDHITGITDTIIPTTDFLNLVRTDVETTIDGTMVNGTGSIVQSENNYQKANSLNLKNHVGSIFENAEKVKMTSGTSTSTPITNTYDAFYRSNYTQNVDNESLNKQSDYYSFSFDPNKASPKVDALKAYNTTSNFPVAGGQFLASIKEGMMTFGVDSDATSLVDENQKQFILASATKNIYLAAELSLWASDRFYYGFRGKPRSIDTVVTTDEDEYIWTQQDQNYYNKLTTPTNETYLDIADDGQGTLKYGWLSLESVGALGTQYKGTTINGGSELVYEKTTGGEKPNQGKLQDSFDWFIEGLEALGFSNIPTSIKELTDLGLWANTLTTNVDGSEYLLPTGKGVEQLIAIEENSPTLISSSESNEREMRYTLFFPNWIPFFNKII